MTMQFNMIADLSELSSSDINNLSASQHGFLNIAFLNALETSGCCDDSSGWEAQHATWRNERGELIGLMPVYKKYHSWGEYVFDWQWAELYQQIRRPYYPKWITAIPFTPVPGKRLLTSEGIKPDLLYHDWINRLPVLCKSEQTSSWHLLFADSFPATDAHLLQRNDCRYTWYNRGDADFDTFLQRFTARKRKNIRRERKALAEAGISCERVPGTEITEQQLKFFYECYCNTYYERGHHPHLTYEFFQAICGSIGKQMVFVLAKSQQYLAAALFFHEDNALYGRYWGATHAVPGLHFECCYYQGIEFCLEKKLDYFDPGTQGEHKISRGFEPSITTSYHYLADQQIHQALMPWLVQQNQAVLAYAEHMQKDLPYNSEQILRSIE